MRYVVFSAFLVNIFLFAMFSYRQHTVIMPYESLDFLVFSNPPTPTHLNKTDVINPFYWIYKTDLINPFYWI